MPTFQYKISTPEGGAHRGEMEGPNADVVEQRLANSGMTVLSIKQKADGINLSIPGLSGVSSRELVVFTRQLSTMIDSGLPIVQALDLLGSQEKNFFFKTVIMSVKADVESGMTFGDSLRKHPSVFDTLYCSLVAAGEVGGVLDTILARLCIQIEKSDAVKRKIKGALTYPVGTLVVAIIITIGMLWKVIPAFQDMFSAMGGKLPALTQFLIDASDWMGANILYIFLTLIIVPVGVFLLLKNYRIKRAVDTVLLAAPIFGPVIQKTAVSRFTRTMGTMITSGVPLMDSLSIVSESSGNIRIKEGILFARKRLSEGSTLADPLMVTGIFPNMVVQMIRVGEETGALDVMLVKVADFYDEEVDDAIGKMMSMIEPLMMLLLGGLVGGMLIGMYLPIFSMSSTAG